MSNDEALCPLCKTPLLLIRHYAIPVDEAPGVAVDPLNCVTDSWEVVCEGGDHRIDSGDVDSDGRTALHGYRSAQSLGGVR